MVGRAQNAGAVEVPVPAWRACYHAPLSSRGVPRWGHRQGDLGPRMRGPIRHRRRLEHWPNRTPPHSATQTVGPGHQQDRRGRRWAPPQASTPLRRCRAPRLDQPYPPQTRDTRAPRLGESERDANGATKLVFDVHRW